MTRLLCISVTNLSLMVFVQEMRRLSQISMTNKLKINTLGLIIYRKKNTAVYFDSFEIVYISQNQRQIYHIQHI